MTVLPLFSGRKCKYPEKMADTLIAPEFVEDALQCLRVGNRDADSILADLGLSHPVLSPVSNELYGRLWRLIAVELQDEFFGLGARPMRPGSFALLCHTVVMARNLKQALRRALLFLSVVLDEPRGKLVVTLDEAQIELLDSVQRPAFAYRTYWLILMGVICWLVGRRIPVRSLDFACPAPENRQDYRKFFGVPVRFDAPVSRLCFDARHLSLPVIRSKKSATSFIRESPANILIRFRDDQRLAIRVREHLSAIAPSDWPAFEDLARNLNRSATTLRRQLRADGQNYVTIKNELRMARAQKMLADGLLSVNQIAIQLGYSEPSAFFRAYRKWNGFTPRSSFTDPASR